MNPEEVVAMIEVLKKGLFTSIQDLGRSEGLAYGVPLSGAMDRSALIRVNMILGNDPGAAVFECTLMGPELKFQKKAVVAITGADMSPRLNGNPISMFQAHSIEAGGILKLGSARNGCRTYIGIKGGISSEIIMGSQSQYEGVTRFPCLQAGMIVNGWPAGAAIIKPASRIKRDDMKFESNEIGVSKGPEFDTLHKEQSDRLVGQVFTVSNLNNRMGCQLVEPLKNELDPIITAPVLPGTVQLTPSGRLIVLMRDAQTTGGYPRVLQLTKRGIDVLAQKQSGDKIRFKI